MISVYSSSFGMASRLLRRPVRDHVRNIYALVRLADEVVDGKTGVRFPQHAGVLLDRLQADTEDALAHGYSANLIVHAFASTARECGIEPRLISPFFGSMRTDLSVRKHDADSFRTYVYGSAEVVGLMCLRVFLAAPGQDGASVKPTAVSHVNAVAAYEELAIGARRLGAAFQKVNFLRDLREDYLLRGRCYFPGIDPQHLTEMDKHRLLAEIDADLDHAAGAVLQLPDSSRWAVSAAHAVFMELSSRLRNTPAEQLLQRRERVLGPTKLRLGLMAGVRQRSR
jgi:phytoene/squalene synthetase